MLNMATLKKKLAEQLKIRLLKALTKIVKENVDNVLDYLEEEESENIMRELEPENKPTLLEFTKKLLDEEKPQVLDKESTIAKKDQTIRTMSELEKKLADAELELKIQQPDSMIDRDAAELNTKQHNSKGTQNEENKISAKSQSENAEDELKKQFDDVWVQTDQSSFFNEQQLLAQNSIIAQQRKQLISAQNNLKNVTENVKKLETELIKTQKELLTSKKLANETSIREMKQLDLSDELKSVLSTLMNETAKMTQELKKLYSSANICSTNENTVEVEEVAVNYSVPKLVLSEPQHLRRLQNIYSQLVERLEAKKVAGRMFSQRAIGRAEMQSIISCRTACEAAEGLLKIILNEQSESLFECFLETLNQTNQQHIASWISFDDDEIDSEHVQLIQRHHVYLVDNIDSLHSGLVDELYARGVIDSRDMEQLKAEQTDSSCNEALLSMLGRKSAKQFEKFLSSLRATGKDFVADELRVSNQLPNIFNESVTGYGSRLLEVQEVECDTMTCSSVTRNSSEMLDHSLTKFSAATLHHDDELQSLTLALERGMLSCSETVSCSTQKDSEQFLIEVCEVASCDEGEINFIVPQFVSCVDSCEVTSCEKDELRCLTKELFDDCVEVSVESCEVETVLTCSKTVSCIWPTEELLLDVCEVTSCKNDELRCLTKELFDDCVEVSVESCEVETVATCSETVKCIWPTEELLLDVCEVTSCKNDELRCLTKELFDDCVEVSVESCEVETVLTCSKTVKCIWPTEELLLDVCEVTSCKNDELRCLTEELFDDCVEVSVESCEVETVLTCSKTVSCIWPTEELLLDVCEVTSCEKDELRCLTEELFDDCVEVSVESCEVETVTTCSETVNCILHTEELLLDVCKVTSREDDEIRYLTLEGSSEYDTVTTCSETVSCSTQFNDSELRLTVGRAVTSRLDDELQSWVVSDATLGRYERQRTVIGLAFLQDSIYAVYQGCNDVEVFKHENDWKTVRPIQVEGLEEPFDMVGNSSTSQLFISQMLSDAILRVDSKSGSSEVFINTGCECTSLSMVDNRLLVTSRDSLLMFDIRSGKRILEVPLAANMKRHEVWYAIESQKERQSFFVCHGPSSGISTVSEIDKKGQEIRVFDNKQQINCYHLALDYSGRLLVTDEKNSQVVLLTEDLEFKRILVDNKQLNNARPNRLLYTQNRHLLAVGLDNGQIKTFGD